MVLHSIGNPELIFPPEPTAPFEEQVIAGGFVQGHRAPDGTFHPRRLVSTDPQMYLRGKYARL